jgi:hypothetical protein
VVAVAVVAVTPQVLYYGRGKLPAVPQKPTKSDDDILKQQYRYERTAGLGRVWRSVAV